MPRRLWVVNRPPRFVSVYITCCGPWIVHIPRFTHWMYTFHGCQPWNVYIQWLACGMYIFHAWPIECIHSTATYIQCIIYIYRSFQRVEHSTKCILHANQHHIYMYILCKMIWCFSAANKYSEFWVYRVEPRVLTLCFQKQLSDFTGVMVNTEMTFHASEYCAIRTV